MIMNICAKLRSFKYYTSFAHDISIPNIKWAFVGDLVAMSCYVEKVLCNQAPKKYGHFAFIWNDFFLSSLFCPFHRAMAFTLCVEKTWRFAIDIHHLRICWLYKMVSIDRLQSKDWYLILIGKHFAMTNLFMLHLMLYEFVHFNFWLLW